MRKSYEIVYKKIYLEESKVLLHMLHMLNILNVNILLITLSI